MLSPFAGIGSEGYEAIKNGRQFIGCELKESYWKQACANLRIAESENKTLFDPGLAMENESVKENLSANSRVTVEPEKP